MLKRTKKEFETGQTLIETVVAVFILIMGITAAVGLAIYAFANSTNITKQIIAVGLAREGVEAVKNMRDTNWLKLDIDDNCHDFTDTVGSNDNDSQCYRNWLGQGQLFWLLFSSASMGYDLDPGRNMIFWGNAGTQTYRLGAESEADERVWELVPATNNFGLNVQENFSSASFKGAYLPRTVLPDGTSDFYRKITLVTEGINQDNPFATNVGRRLQVIVQVWWTDKKCPRVPDYPQAKAACRIELQSYLTNWKDY